MKRFDGGRSCSVVLAFVVAVGGMVWAVPLKTSAQGKVGKPEPRADRDATTWNFDGQKTGTAVAGWKIARTGAKAKPAQWEIVADRTAPSGPHVVAVTKTENTGDTFNLLIAEGVMLKDLNLEAKVKAVSGKKNQGSGVIWRAVDPNNYYLARWTPLSNNFRVYCVKEGKPRRLANVNVKADRKAWHTIQVNQQGDRIVASLDGKKLIDVKDTALSRAGMIGLVTKADAAAAFDDVRVQEIRSESSQP